MKTQLFSGIVLVCLIGTALSQTCDTNSNTNTCGNGQVCRSGTCQDARSCDNDRECTEDGVYPDDACVDYLCQPEFCSTQGQCAGDDRYECSNDTMARRCVETWIRTGRVDREARVYFGIVPYDSYVMWYKGSRDNLIITKDTVNDVTTYYGEWCNGTASCSSSPRGEILSYGWLKINNVQESDGGYYYWNQNFTNGKENTGYDHQVDLQIKTKDCSSQDNTACWYDEICRNDECVKADRCTNNNDTQCTVQDEVCVGTYCQPEFCKADGDCARYKYCTNDTGGATGRCVRQQFIFGREERERRIYLPDFEPFEAIRWYKNRRDNMVVEYANNVTTFFGDLCDNGTACNTTTRARLEDDGDLTLLSCETSDEAIYYYNLNTTNGKEDPGYDFQIDMRVTPNNCNRSSDQNQCYWDEICRDRAGTDKCELATSCDTNANCTGGDVCVSQYCQPEFCDADNVCAAYYSYRCSDDSPDRRCVRSSYYFSQREGREARLSLPVVQPYNGVTWYKANRANFIAKNISGNVEYGNSFCEGSATTCTTSYRGSLQPDGVLVINSAWINDTDNYFYDLNLISGVAADNPGLDYQLLLRVYPDFAPTSQCGGELTASSGMIESVNYPADYRNYLRCYWTLNIPTALNIDWEIVNLDLEDCCACDYLEFKDSQDTLLTKYCQGNGTAGVKFTTSNNVKINFLTDFTINRPGFQISWAQNGTVQTTVGPTTTTTTAANPPTTTADNQPTTTADNQPTTTGDNQPTTTADNQGTTTEAGAVAIAPGRLTFMFGVVIVLVFRWLK